MFRKLDDAVYMLVSKPLINSLQQWFHWNRYLLIAKCLKHLSILFMVTAVSAASLIVYEQTTTQDVHTVSIALALVVGAFVVANVKRFTPVIIDLQKCSSVFEEGQAPTPSAATTSHLRLVRYYGPDYALFCLLSGGNAILRIVRESYDSVGLYAITSLVLAMSMFEWHLWRSSDVDPKDRRSVMEPEGQTSSAS